MGVSLRAAFAILGLIGLVAGAALRAQQTPPGFPAQQTPTFRAGITAVPLEVRVLDRDGRPVTDLEEHEFTILEDGVAQDITHFSRHLLVAAEPRPGLRARPDAPLFDVSPADFRVFLLVVMGGSLNPNWNTAQAAARFIRERLLPQDQVALFSGSRPTDFTTDHERIAQALERLAGVRSQPTAPGRRDSVFRDRARVDSAPAPTGDLGFADYASARGHRGAIELGVLRYAIGYLRYMRGEKHIIVLSRNGLPFNSSEDVKRLAVDASDARVALDVILTGGIPADPAGGFGAAGSIPADEPRRPPDAGTAPAAPRASASQPCNPRRARSSPRDPDPADARLRAGAHPRGTSPGALIAHADNRAAARMTGGQAWTNAMPAKALEVVDTSSRCYYLLAALAGERRAGRALPVDQGRGEPAGCDGARA